MCRGRVESRNQDQFSSDDEDIREMCVCNNHHSHFSTSTFSCELCDSEASVYCQADDAYLCRKCDVKVHSANFLAQRHIRCFLCTNCRAFTNRYLIGVSAQVLLPTIVCKKLESIENHSTDDDSDAVQPNYSNQFIRPFLIL